MSTSAAPTAPPSETGEYTHRQILTIITGLMMGMFLGALDQTIVSTSIRTISDDLHGLSMQAWVTTAYLITSTITTPIYGRLGDIYGRKKLFMFAISVFIAGSALCSFATSMYMLAAFRAVQGIGAGGLFTLVLAIIGDIVSPRERARYTGYFMATFGTSSVLGPVIGGFFASHAVILGLTGWRWVFLVNVPIGIAALFVVYRTLHVHHERREARIDWWGAVTLVVALVPLLTVAEQGRAWGWDSGRAMACYVIGVIGLGAFYAVERRMGDARDDPAPHVPASARLGRHRGQRGHRHGAVRRHHRAPALHADRARCVADEVRLPDAADGDRDDERLDRLRPGDLAHRAASAGSRSSARPSPRSRLLALSRIGADTALPVVMVLMLLLGYGLGNCMQPLLLILQSAVPPRDIGVATASATFFRQIGGTIGVAIFLSILFGRSAATSAPPSSPSRDAGVRAGRPAPGHAARPPVRESLQVTATAPSSARRPTTRRSSRSSRPCSAHPFKVGFAESMDTVFLFAGLVGVARVPHPAADAEGRAARHVGECGRALRGGADGSRDGPGLRRSASAKRGRVCVTSSPGPFRRSGAVPP